MTNNQIERSLRYLILKRKISFGPFTKHTTEKLSILMPIIMLFRQRH